MDCFTLFLNTNDAISYANFKAEWNINWANYLEVGEEYDLEISLRTEPETNVSDVPDHLYHLKSSSLAGLIRSCVAVDTLPDSNPDTNTNISIGKVYQTTDQKEWNSWRRFSVVFLPNENVPVRLMGIPQNDFILEIRDVNNNAIVKNIPFTAMLRFKKVDKYHLSTIY